jgi:hypothetical protein
LNLEINPNLADPDRAYEALIAMHDGRSDDESLRLNARLVLILLNHIGDEAVCLAAIKLASESLSR